MGNRDLAQQRALSYLERSVQQLQGMFPTGDLPRVVEEKWVIRDEGNLGRELEEKIRIFGLEDEPQQLFLGGPDAVGFFESVRNLPALHNEDADVGEEQVPKWFAHPLLIFLNDYLNQVGGARWEKETAITVFRKWWADWELRRIPYRCQAPLLNFDSELEELRFSDKLYLRSLPNAEKSEFLSPFLFQRPYVMPFDLAKAKYQLCGYQEIPRGEAIDMSPLIESARHAITALRLLRAGHVGASVISMSPEAPAIPNFRMSSPVQELGAHGSRPYRLEAADDTSLRTLFDLMAAESGKGSGLSLALRHFNQSYTRDRAEDRLLDLTIALESTVLHGVQDELRYRLALRGATLLRSSRNAVETFGGLRALYDVRSLVVHEGLALTDLDLVKMGGMQLQGFLDFAEDVTREILRHFLMEVGRGLTLETIIHDIDAMILHGRP